MPISKIDAARRQLDTANELFFSRGDPIAVATLAYNALEISATLAGHRSAEDWTKFNEVAVLHGVTTKEVRDVFHAPRNFFKHADRDSEATLSSYEDNDAMHLLALTILQFGEVAERSVEMWSLLVWFYAANRDFTAPDAMRDLVAEFSHLANLDRDAQIAQRPLILSELRRRVQTPWLAWELHVYLLSAIAL